MSAETPKEENQTPPPVQVGWRAAELGCSVRKVDLGAPGGSKVGRGCDLVCKEYNPTVPKKEEHGRSSDINQGQTTLIDCWASL
ncbi:hypothetical protein Anapl_10700 [Anas platyrhynchos]|uniref:Uncharacterized protein n=1 Tax=Anas platyrhynchos TaxID=8839 RepID=R0LYQ8_ANAPL|nr:hypothetical protein Anapl_10700 [Anas platyrhynchos]